jgi:hypothetical protein
MAQQVGSGQKPCCLTPPPPPGFQPAAITITKGTAAHSIGYFVMTLVKKAIDPAPTPRLTSCLLLLLLCCCAAVAAIYVCRTCTVSSTLRATTSQGCRPTATPGIHPSANHCLCSRKRYLQPQSLYDVASDGRLAVGSLPMRQARKSRFRGCCH